MSITIITRLYCHTCDSSIEVKDPKVTRKLLVRRRARRSGWGFSEKKFYCPDCWITTPAYADYRERITHVAVPL